MTDERLALIGTAIDGLAAAATAGDAEMGHLAAQLADVWSMVAELDAGLAARLARYTSAG